eukprot:7379510-Lingulodinium_polyedra.AAC.1
MQGPSPRSRPETQGQAAQAGLRTARTPPSGGGKSRGRPAASQSCPRCCLPRVAPPPEASGPAA